MRETVDVTDNNILLALREGPQGLKSLSTLADINYNTLRQRIDKLSRYGYISRPDYGEYALTGKERHAPMILTGHHNGRSSMIGAGASAAI